MCKLIHRGIMYKNEFRRLGKVESISDEEFERETGFKYADDLRDDLKDK